MPTPKGRGGKGNNLSYSTKFSWKLHENEKIGIESKVLLCISATGNMEVKRHWRIQGGGHQGRPCEGSKFFHFHAVLGKKIEKYSTFGSWRTPFGKILDPPLNVMGSVELNLVKFFISRVCMNKQCNAFNWEFELGARSGLILQFTSDRFAPFSFCHTEK